MHSDTKLLFSAAVAEFATLLKENAFPTEVLTKVGGGTQSVVYLPKISWSPFCGTIVDAIDFVQSKGLFESRVQADANESLWTTGSNGSQFDA